MWSSRLQSPRCGSWWATSPVFPSTAWSFEGGAGGGGCLPKGFKTRGISLGLTDPGRDLFLTGDVSARIATIELRFDDGSRLTVRPVEEAVLDPLPHRRDLPAALVVAIGYAENGVEVDRKRFDRSPG